MNQEYGVAISDSVEQEDGSHLVEVAVKSPSRERRLRVFWLPQEYALDMLRGFARSSKFVYLPEIGRVPVGAEVKTCFYSQSRQAFGVIVAHPSFEDVPDGMEIPGENCAAIEYKAFRIAADGVIRWEGTQEQREALRESIAKLKLGPTIIAPMEAHCGFEIEMMSREELITLREEINTRIYDLERQPAG